MGRPQVSVNKLYTLTGHSDCVYSLTLAPEETVFFSSGGDGQIAQWDLQDPHNGKLIAKVPASVYGLHYWEEKEILIVGQNFEGIHLIDLKEKKEIGSLELTQAAIFDIKTRGHIAWVACGDGWVHRVDLNQLVVTQRWRHSEKSARCLALHPTQDELAIGYSDSHIRIVDLVSGELKQEWQGHDNSVFTLAFDPQGRWLLSGSRDAKLKIWEIQQGDYQLKQEVVAHLYAINHISFRPDGRYFATGSMDKAVKVWDAETLQLLKVIDKARHAGHGTSVNKLLWTSFKGQLVSASDDRSISVWDIDFEKE